MTNYEDSSSLHPSAGVKAPTNRVISTGLRLVLPAVGGAGIEENLLSGRMRHQRCMWHGKHDFPDILYTEGLKKPDQKPFIDQLHAIAAMSMTKAKLEKLKPKDRTHVRQLAQQTRLRPPTSGLQPSRKLGTNSKLVMKHFLIQTHAFAKKASMAMLAAARQGKFWEMHEKFYASQKELNDAKIEAIAQETGLDMQRFNADLKDPAIWALIVRDMQDGRQAEVRGTPTIFINGKLLNQRSLAGFTEAIEAELKKKR